MTHKGVVGGCFTRHGFVLRRTPQSCQKRATTRWQTPEAQAFVNTLAWPLTAMHAPAHGCSAIQSHTQTQPPRSNVKRLRPDTQVAAVLRSLFIPKHTSTATHVRPRPPARTHARIHRGVADDHSRRGPKVRPPAGHVPSL